MEKSYPAFWRDLTPEYTALEAGLDRFIHLQKPDFVGREALLSQRKSGLSRKRVVLKMESEDANPFQNEVVYRMGRPVGRITSAAYGHLVGSCLAHAYVDVNHAVEGTRIEVGVLGKPRTACIVAPSPWDPENARPRS
jgi:dimethylglycine dehydrogenase